jgi:hypothetical protein
MIVDYRRSRPLTDLQRSERQAWWGFAIWIPATVAAPFVLAGLSALIAWIVR